MEKKKSNNTILYGGLAVLAIVGISSFAQKKPTAMIGNETFNDGPGTTPPPSAPPTPKTINKALILKNGSKGIEVAELQKLLGITTDGIFGNNTEKALLAVKGVSQISLNAFASTPNKNNNPYNVGDKIMSDNLKGAQLYKSETKANGIYFTNWEKDSLINYGQAIGTIKGFDAGRTVYSVYVESWLGKKVVFVKAQDVKKY